MSIAKTSYKESYNKKAVREAAFSRFKLQKIIGLGGPDLINCVNEYRRSGFKEITVYENNKRVMLLQAPQLPRAGIIYQFQDIINAPSEKDVVYDLDFCGRLSTIEKYVKKFTSNFILTVSERGLKRFASMGLFLRIRDERFKSILHINDDCKVIESDHAKYLATAYRDTSPMLIIHKL